LGTVFLVGSLAYANQIFLLLPHLNLFSKHILSFMIGGVAFGLLWLLFFSGRGSFWSTLEHEFTHAVFATLFLKRVHSLRASIRKGGSVTMEEGNVVIALAPYAVPLLSLILILLKFIIKSNYSLYINFLIGFTYFNHLKNLIQEFRFGQPDIQISGVFFSSVFILFFNIFFTGLIFFSLPEEISYSGRFLSEGLAQTWNLFAESWIYLKQLMRK